jgi:hypothetical protein
MTEFYSFRPSVRRYMIVKFMMKSGASIGGFIEVHLPRGSLKRPRTRTSRFIIIIIFFFIIFIVFIILPFPKKKEEIRVGLVTYT